MSFSVGHTFSGDSGSHLAQIINNLNAGIWEFNISSRAMKWSDGFYMLLGYSPGEIDCSSHVFFRQLLCYEDKDTFLNALTPNPHNRVHPIQIRLLTKMGDYHWFESFVKRITIDEETIICGSISDINDLKTTDLKSKQNELLYHEAGRMGKFGTWEVDVETMSLSFSEPTYDIFEMEYQTALTVDNAINFFEPPYRPLIQTGLDNAIKHCQPYDFEVLLRTAKDNVIWVRTKGIPIVNNQGKCISIRGFLQDIDQQNRKAKALESSVNLLTDQNRRLQNFAYIVSHNLRSHTGNLRFMVNLYEQSEVADDRAEIFSHIQSISSSLNNTLENLNEIVKIQTEIGKERSVVEFKPLFENIKLGLKANIEALDATVEYDFSECPQVSYIPAYMESIFQNLLTNALKYHEPSRKPVIKCYTYQHGTHIYLIFEDNGQGLDMERYGDKVFGMYKTFHQNADAKGIGLFITRNQIEALGGTIKVQSAVDQGAKFTIRLT